MTKELCPTSLTRTIHVTRKFAFGILPSSNMHRLFWSITHPTHVTQPEGGAWAFEVPE